MISLHSKRENDFVSRYIQNKLNATENPYLYIGKFSKESSKGKMGTSISIVTRLAHKRTVIINFFRIVFLAHLIKHTSKSKILARVRNTVLTLVF